MITEEQLKKIAELAVDWSWNKAFCGKAKGNRHLFRTTKLAKELAEIEDARVDVVEAGAWLHDSGLKEEIFGDPLAAKNELVDFFRSIGVGEKDMVAVLHCIEAHDGRIPAHTTEAKIVRDADTLEKMGPLGIIRETWKRSQVGWPTEKIANHLQSHFEKRKADLVTEKAKKRADKLMASLETFFKVLKEQIKE